MNPAIHIAYRQLDPSESLSTCIEGEFERLARYYRRPAECHVTVERTHRAAVAHLRVRVELEVQGKTLVADRTPTLDEETDPYLEVREAFRVLRRQLGRYVQHHSPWSGPRVVDYAPRR